MPESENPYESSKVQSVQNDFLHKWDRWTRIHERGRSSYVWRYGVFGWGFSTALFWILWMGWSQGWDRLPYLVVTALVLFPLSGYVWGIFMWRKIETQYKAERNTPAHILDDRIV